MLACGQCFMTIAQCVAIVSAAFTPLLFYMKGILSRKKN